MLQEDGSGSLYPSTNNSTYEDNSSPINNSAQEDNNTSDDDVSGLYQTTFSFDSYKDMIKAFFNDDTNSSSAIQELKKHMDESYTHFVDSVNTDKSFPQPFIDNKPITYRNKEGFSNITFFVNELYELPWIWYFPHVSTGENLYISMTYLQDSEKQRNMTASEVIKKLSPDSANIDNLGTQHENIYNKQMKLNDREVTALVMEYKEGTRDSIFFVYDDFLVHITYNSEVWSEQWFSSLSFKSVK